TGTVRLALADATGAPVATVEALTMRPASADRLTAAAVTHHDALHRVEWTPLTAPATDTSTAAWAVVGDDTSPLATALTGAGVNATAHAGLDAAAADAPGLVVLSSVPHDGDDLAASVHTRVAAVLEPLQQWLADPRFEDTR